MTINNEQIQALEASALAATTGDWTADDNFGFTIQCYRTGTNRLLATVNGPNAENDMRFIAQASPQNILRVLAERDADKALIAEQAKRIAELETREVREDGNQFLVVRHPGKAPVIKHCAGDLEEFLYQLLKQDNLATIDIITHRYYGVGGQWVQDADEYLHMMSAAGITLTVGE